MESTPNPTVPSPTDSASASPTNTDATLGLTTISSLLDRLDQPPADDGDPRRTNPLEASSKVSLEYQDQLVRARLGMASSLYVALRAKHAPTAFHSLRVAFGCSSWALQLDLQEPTRDEWEVAALLHDIGKIGVPDRILSKPQRLDREEMATMNRHRVLGEQILASCCVSQEVLAIVRYAPAWYDGSRTGFDRCGLELPLGARAISILDAFDAMTTDQVYRRAMSRERAIAELFACAGTQFDPELVERFCALLTTDQAKLTTDLSHRWLNELSADQSNALWNCHSASGLAWQQQATVDALFHQKLLDSMHDGVVFIDTNLQILLWNRAAERLTAISAASVLHRLWAPQIIGLRDENGSPLERNNCPIAHTLNCKVQTLRRLTMEGRGGERVSVDAQLVPVMGRDGIMLGATLLLHDASSQITLEERVQTLHIKATRDPLTRVANRAEFDRLHTEFVDTHLDSGLPCALIICDIDHFKSVNDTYGHQAGDEVLVSFAALLQRSARPGDLVARYGGEEFVMLCADCDNATITQRAEKIRRDLQDTPQGCLDSRPITASFGVTEIQAGDTPETMLRRADRALLRAKESGRNRVVQLGTGIPGEMKRARRQPLRRWFQPTPSSHLLAETLVTAVPLPVTMEKLRGFISDHHAEIMSTEDGKLRLQITKQSPATRRDADRPVCFIVSLQFVEKRAKDRVQALPGRNRTMIHVSIQLANNRDRRLGNAYERARQLFASLKSYFMAQTFDGPFSTDESRANPTLFRRLLSLLHPRTHDLEQ